MSDFRVRPGKPVAQELARVLDAQLRRALARLKTWEDDPERAFHEVRRRLKKARAAARVARGVDKSLAREINGLTRDAARALSGARDADVVRAAAEKLAAACPDEAAGTALLKFALHAEREQSGGGVRKASAREAAAKIAKTLDLSRRLADAEAPAKALKRSAKRAFRRADRAFVAAHGEGGPRAAAEELRHNWRKRVKDLWYVERLLADVWPLERRPRERLTNELGKLLGAERDLLLLAARLRSSARACGGAQARDKALAFVERERSRVMAEAQTLGRRAHSAEPRVRAAAAARTRGARKTQGRAAPQRRRRVG